MHNKINAVLDKIESKLSSDDILKFEIRVTENDLCKDDDYPNYHKGVLIAVGKNRDIIQAKKDLVKLFKSKSDLVEKCMNPNDETDDNRAVKLYIIVRFNLMEQIPMVDLQIVHLDLFDFAQIELD